MSVAGADTVVTASGPAVEIHDLRIELTGSHKDIVDEVGIRIGAGEVLGLVGESGLGQDDGRDGAARLLPPRRRGQRRARC